MMRVLCFIGLLLLATLSPLWVWLGAVVVYLIVFGGLEALILAAGIDAYYGFTGAVPLYVVSTALATIAITYLRPYLAV